MWCRTVVLSLCLACVCLIGTAQEPPKQITFGEKLDLDPMVSPDGNHLAFASNRTGEFDIFLITFGKAGTVQLTQSNKDDRHPNWTPDNKTVLFDSKRTGGGDLYETARDGSSGFLQLSDRGDIDLFPSVSKDGKAVLYASGPKKKVQFRTKLNVVMAEEKAQANKARILAEGNEPRFSPDGTQIVFVSKRTKNKDIWLMNSYGGMQTQLTTEPKDDEQPAFSPDGKSIIFASKRTGNFDLWVMEADGSNARQLTTDPTDEVQPCWSSGGYIYYVKHVDSGKANIYRIKAP